MRLDRLKLTSVRKLDPGCLIEGLSPGLNVIGGDNEEGKSSLLLALKCALFLNHASSGQLRDRLKPYGSNAVPEIEVDFEIGGRRFEMVKPFKKAGMRLTVEGKLFKDAEAEEELERSLRFARRRAPKELVGEDLGLAGLFWVDQGTSFTPAEPAQDGKRRIGDLLAREIGTAVGGEDAERVLQRVWKRAEPLWTKQLKPRGTGPLVDAKRACDEAQTQFEELQALKNAFEAATKERDELLDETRRAATADEAGRLERKIADAEATIERLKAVNLGVVAKAHELDSAKRIRTDHERTIERRSEWSDEIARAREQLVSDKEVLRGISDALARIEAERQTLIEAEETAEEMSRSVSSALAEAERLARQQHMGSRLENLRDRANVLRSLDELLARLHKRISLNFVDDKKLKDLRQADRDARDAAASLAAVATRLEFAPNDGQAVTIGGKPHDPAKPLDLSEPSDIRLEGFGALKVVPGGGDVRQARERASETAQKLANLLKDLALPDLKAVEVAAADRKEAILQEKSVLAERQRLLGDETAEGLALAIGELEAQLGETEPGTAAAEPIETVRERSRLAREAYDEAVKAVRAADRAYDERRREEAGKGALIDERSGKLMALEKRLEAERAELPDADLALLAAEAGKAETRLAKELADLRLALGDDDPEVLQEKVVMNKRALTRLQERASERRDRLRELDFQIKEGGGQGIGERQEIATEKLEAANAEMARLTGEAEALKLLVQTLEAEIRAARDRFTGPIRERLTPLLRQVIPHAVPAIDPQKVSLAELERGGQSEPWDELSLGTREQLAILVRLAFADLFLEHDGEAPPLILDDALVYADEKRFEDMLRLLQRRAERQQIVVLTCRPRLYDMLDAKFYDLADCRLS